MCDMTHSYVWHDSSILVVDPLNRALFLFEQEHNDSSVLYATSHQRVFVVPIFAFEQEHNFGTAVVWYGPFILGLGTEELVWSQFHICFNSDSPISCDSVWARISVPLEEEHYFFYGCFDKQPDLCRDTSFALFSGALSCTPHKKSSYTIAQVSVVFSKASAGDIFIINIYTYTHKRVHSSRTLLQTSRAS